MGMVAPPQRIASAYFVVCGQYGDVSRSAEERGVCRQWLYREADGLRNFLATSQEKIDALQQRVRELEQQQAGWERRLALSVVLDEEKQAQLAAVGQAQGVSLPIVWTFLAVLIPDANAASGHARTAWRKAAEALDDGSDLEDAWDKTKQALRLVTPPGDLHTRPRALALLAQTLPQLPDGAVAKSKRQLQKPEMLHYRDHVPRPIEALPFTLEVK